MSLVSGLSVIFVVLVDIGILSGAKERMYKTEWVCDVCVHRDCPSETEITAAYFVMPF